MGKNTGLRTRTPGFRHISGPEEPELERVTFSLVLSFLIRGVRRLDKSTVASGVARSTVFERTVRWERLH